MQQRVENTKFIVSESRAGSQDGSRLFGSREEETARIVEAFEEEKFVSDTSDLEVLFYCHGCLEAKYYRTWIF